MVRPRSFFRPTRFQTVPRWVSSFPARVASVWRTRCGLLVRTGDILVLTLLLGLFGLSMSEGALVVILPAAATLLRAPVSRITAHLHSSTAPASNETGEHGRCCLVAVDGAAGRGGAAVPVGGVCRRSTVGTRPTASCGRLPKRSAGRLRG